MNLHLTKTKPEITFVIGSDIKQWTGGLQYFNNLLYAIRQTENRDNVILSAITPSEIDLQNLSQYLDHVYPMPGESIFSKILNRKPVQDLLTKFKLDITPPSPISSFLKNKTDVVFSKTDLGPQFKIPHLSWIPDFQHIHLPEMFTKPELEFLEGHFSRVVKHANTIILSSQTALKDFENLYPDYKHKARVMSFVANIPSEIYEDHNTSWICKQYNLPEKFFYLPNQFWKHKNHTTVLKALSIAKKQNPEISIICTGNLNDYRNPGYLSELLLSISENNLRDNFVILGMVPRKHLFSLTRHSLAVLQASLFEGWSTTVEEAKSIGKNMIVSDLPIHREQNPPDSLYFPPLDADKLADILVKCHTTFQPGPNIELEHTAKQSLPVRIREFGNTFLQIALEGITPVIQ